jgi:hypothetical protein
MFELLILHVFVILDIIWTLWKIAIVCVVIQSLLQDRDAMMEIQSLEMDVIVLARYRLAFTAIIQISQVFAISLPTLQLLLNMSNVILPAIKPSSLFS